MSYMNYDKRSEPENFEQIKEKNDPIKVAGKAGEASSEYLYFSTLQPKLPPKYPKT